MKRALSWFLLAGLLIFTVDLILGALRPTTCLALADHTASANALREAAKSAKNGDKDLCEGLALLAEQQGTQANDRLARAMAIAAPEDRWSIQGHYALALALSNQSDAALRNWEEAIAAGESHGNVDRVNLFRGARATHLAINRQYGAALKDFEAVYNQTSHDTVRGVAAYNAFKVAFLDGDEALVERWFPLAFDALDKAGDAEHLTYATEVYGQLLDDRGDFAESAALYQKGLAATTGWGEEYWHAELLEFAGQSRFAAGDFAKGEQFYSDSAAMYRRAGEPEYASRMDSNLKARKARHEFEASIR